jgi:hypothetical protein
MLKVMVLPTGTSRKIGRRWRILEELSTVILCYALLALSYLDCILGSNMAPVAERKPKKNLSR